MLADGIQPEKMGGRMEAPQDPIERTQWFTSGLRMIFGDKGFEVMMKAKSGDDLGNRDRIACRTIRKSMQHPSMQAFFTAYYGEVNEWEEATCNNYPLFYLSKKGYVRTPEGGLRRDIEMGCIECPLLDRCEALVETIKPEMGIWAGMRRSIHHSKKNSGYNPDDTPTKIRDIVANRNGSK